MKAVLKAELKTWAQYVVAAVLAGYLGFGITFGGVRGLNQNEAWLNYEPLLRQWLVIFVALGAVRLLLVLLFYKLWRR
jgi:hypothetical protein